MNKLLIRCLAIFGMLTMALGAAVPGSVRANAPKILTTVQGHVLDATPGGHTWPLYARVEISGESQPLFTNPLTGAFSIQLNSGITRTFTIIPLLPGYQNLTETFTPSGPLMLKTFTPQITPDCSAPGYQLIEGKSDACQKIAGGLALGNVLDANLGSGLNAASVNANGVSGLTVATPNDPNLPDGFYSAFLPAGQNLPISVSAQMYMNTNYLAPLVMDDQVYPLDFSLLTGRMVVSRQSIEMDLPYGSQFEDFILIQNIGDATLKYSIKEYPEVSWLFVDPLQRQGFLLPGEKRKITISFDFQGLPAHSFQNELRIGTNTPYALATLPVNIQVLPPAGYSLLKGSVYGLKQCDQLPGLPLENATLNVIDKDGQQVATLTTAIDGSYEWMGSAESAPLDIQVLKDGYREEWVSDLPLPPDASLTHPVWLRPLSVCISPFPPQIEQYININQVMAQPLQIINTGAIDAQITISESLLKEDVPWMNETLTSGLALADGGWLETSVMFNSMDMFYGNFNAVLNITWNDAKGSAKVPVVMHITSNMPPHAENDLFKGFEDLPLVIEAPGVLANDSDQELSPLYATLETPPTHGQVTLALDGSFSYTPDPDYNGKDSFTYRVSDGTWSSLAAAQIMMRPSPDLPRAQGESYSVEEDAPLKAALLANDSDPDGTPVTLSLVSAPLHGSLVYLDEQTGNFTYQPESNFFGADAFVYAVYSDGEAVQATATLQVTPLNDAPQVFIPLPDQLAPAFAPLAFTVDAASFADSDGDPLIYRATLENGAPLPAWLHFDPAALAFSGLPTCVETLRVRVFALDGGLGASSTFELQIGGQRVFLPQVTR